MAEGPLDLIRQFQGEIESYLGAMPSRGSKPTCARPRGPAIGWPETPVSVLTAVLDAFRKGIQSIAESLDSGRPLASRPTEDLRRACDLRVVALLPGSLRIALRLPDEMPADIGPTAPARRTGRAVAIRRGADPSTGVP